MGETVKVCLDLNIWCSALLSARKGNQGSVCQYLVKYAKNGFYDFGRFYVIISLGMLERLETVLQRKEIGLSTKAANFYVETIYARTTVIRQLTLGGGLIALKDIEDAGVLETALAGKAQALVTQNFKDFTPTYNNTKILNNNTKIIEPNNHAIYKSAEHSLHIVQPHLMMQWLRQDNIPIIN